MMPFLIGAGIGLAAIGTFTQMDASSKQNKANKAGIEAQMRMEEARKEAMQIDADRRRRQLIRQALIARSQALTTATSQGASQGSGLAGSYGQIAGQLGFGIAGINSQERLGNAIFQGNMDLFNAKMQQSDAEQQSQIGKGISSLGGAILSNATQLTSMGETFMGSSPYQTGSVGQGYGTSGKPVGVLSF